MEFAIQSEINFYTEDGSWNHLYSIAQLYFTMGKYKQAMAFIVAALNNEIDGDDLYDCYLLAYHIYTKLDLQKEANKYYDALLAIDFNKTPGLLDDYKKFYFIPKLYMKRSFEMPAAWFDTDKIAIIGDDTFFEDSDYVAIMQDDMIPDPYSFEIAYLTGINNNKDMVVLNDNKSYLISARLLKKMGVKYDDFLLAEKATAIEQCMKCYQATVTKYE